MCDTVIEVADLILRRDRLRAEEEGSIFGPGFRLMSPDKSRSRDTTKLVDGGEEVRP